MLGPSTSNYPISASPASKREKTRLDAITELVAQGMSEEEAIAIVDAREDASRNRVPSDISAGGDALSLGVPGKSIEAEELKRAEDRRDQYSGLSPLPEAPEQVGRQTPLRILELLGNVGGSIMDSRAIGKANKATAQAQARANLINTLRGRQTASVSPRRPKSGILATLARGLGGGARAIREGREAEAAGEQSRFTNEMSLEEARGQRFKQHTDRLKAEKALNTGGQLTLAGAKPTMEAIGQDIWDGNGSMPQKGFERELKANPRYISFIRANPHLGHEEVFGLAWNGYLKGEDRSLVHEDRGLEGEARADENKEKEWKTRLEAYNNEMDGEIKKALYAPPTVRPPISGKLGKIESRKFSEPLSMMNKFENLGYDEMDATHQALADSLHAKWTGQYYVDLHKKIAADEEAAQNEVDASLRNRKYENSLAKDAFAVRNKLRESLDALPVVRAYSGLQGIGGAFARLRETYDGYGEENRAADQIAIVNQFQRLIDPATVRFNDIQLIREAESIMASIEGRFESLTSGTGGFIADETIDGMFDVAERLHGAQQDFLEDTVSGRIKVWNTFFKDLPNAYIVTEDDKNIIVEGISGGSVGEGGTIEIEEGTRAEG